MIQTRMKRDVCMKIRIFSADWENENNELVEEKAGKC